MFKSLAAHVYVPTFHSIPTYFQNKPFQHQIPIAQNQNIDEDFENYQPFDGLGRPKTSIFMCAFKPHNFWGVISASDNDCQRFYTPRIINVHVRL